MIDTTYPLFLAVAALGYVLLSRQLVRATQSLRFELARRGERLRRNPALPSDRKANVEKFMDSAFDEWIVPVVAVVLPLFSLYFLYLLVKERGFKDEAATIRDQELRREYILVRAMSMLSIMALSPIASVVLIVECLGLLLVFVPFPVLIGAIGAVVAHPSLDGIFNIGNGRRHA